MLRYPASLILAAALLLSACGGAGESDEPADQSAEKSPPAESVQGCAGTPPTTEIVASKSLFDKECVGAKAGQPLKLMFRNDDSYQHNFAVYKGAGLGDKKYASPFFDGASQNTAEVPALEAGTYRFECNIHPAIMEGEYVVT